MEGLHGHALDRHSAVGFSNIGLVAFVNEWLQLRIFSLDHLRHRLVEEGVRLVRPILGVQGSLAL